MVMFAWSTFLTGMDWNGVFEIEYRLFPVGGRVLGAGAEVHRVLGRGKTHIKVSHNGLL